MDVLKDHEAVRQLGSILKVIGRIYWFIINVTYFQTNVRACKALGHPYVLQLGRIYLDMLNVYKVMSENITAAITHNGEQVALKLIGRLILCVKVTKQPLIKSMRVVKKETLKLISNWVERSNDPQVDPSS